MRSATLLTERPRNLRDRYRGRVGRRRMNGQGVAAAAVTLAAAIMLRARPVEACSCAPWEAGRDMIPATGTTGFPTDGRLRIFFRGFPPVLRQRMGAEYRCVIPTARWCSWTRLPRARC